MVARALGLFVTGAGGQVGSDLTALGEAGDGIVVEAHDRTSLDIGDAAAVARSVAAFSSRHNVGRVVVVNCAAWTDVNGAESHEAAAFAANAVGAEHVARAAAAVGAELVHLSTDYVFAGDATDAATGTASDDGKRGNPRHPYEVDDPVGPLNAYGRTKLAGEWAVRATCPRSWVLRTAWVYGSTGTNFVTTIVRLLGERGTVSVVDDQHGSPTWSRDLAEGILALAARQPEYGVLHLTGAGEATWYEFAQAVAVEHGYGRDSVTPRPTGPATPGTAVRPSYSRLSLSAWAHAGLPAPPHWRESLTRFVAGNAPRSP